MFFHLCWSKGHPHSACGSSPSPGHVPGPQPGEEDEALRAQMASPWLPRAQLLQAGVGSAGLPLNSCFGPIPATRLFIISEEGFLTVLCLYLCRGCAICQGGQAYYLNVRGTNSPFPRKSVRDKNKWAVLFLLLREAGTQDGEPLFCSGECIRDG